MAQISGTILKIDLKNRTIVLKYIKGDTQRVQFLKDASFTRGTQPTELSNFKVGEQVVVIVSGSMVSETIMASALYDKIDSPNPDKPGVPITGVVPSGYALTWGGASAPPSMNSLSIVQKVSAGSSNSLAGPGGSFTMMPPAAPPPGLTMPPVQSRYAEAENFKWLYQDVGGSATITPKSNVMTAAPAPTGSPMIGQALSPGYPGAIPGAAPGMQPVQYQSYAQPADLMGSPGNMKLPGLEEAQTEAQDGQEGQEGQENEAAFQPQYRMDIYGQIAKVDAGSNTIHIITNDQQLLSIVISKDTLLNDFTSGKTVKIRDFAPGDQVQVLGIQQSPQVVEAKNVILRQRHPVK